LQVLLRKPRANLFPATVISGDIREANESATDSAWMRAALRVNRAYCGAAARRRGLRIDIGDQITVTALSKKRQ
jgi:hypothetical protein